MLKKLDKNPRSVPLSTFTQKWISVLWAGDPSSIQVFGNPFSPFLCNAANEPTNQPKKGRQVKA